MQKHIAFLAIAAACASATAAWAEESKPSRPNILFIMSDDHAYQAIGCYGSKMNATPNIDRIAREGIRFDNCFVTNSICGPCRAVILTGKYSHLNGFIDNRSRFDGSQQTVAKLLQKAGYQTAIIGKWHLVSQPTGFDYWHILRGQGPYYNPVMLTPEGQVKHTGYTTEIIADLTLDWLEKGRDKSKPFFLMMHNKAPHRNWMPGPKQLANYDDKKIPEPDTLFDDYSGRASPARNQEMTIARHMNAHDLKLAKQRGLTSEQQAAWDKAYEPKNSAFRAQNLEGKDLVRWKYQRYMKDYLRCIDAVDEGVGRVLDALDKSGLADNTLVIYTSDQGFYLGEHGWYDKRWMYEESLRTPLVMRWPAGIKPGGTRQEMVLNLDFPETFLELAGAAVPDDMQGRSLAPLLAGQQVDDWRKRMYYHYYEFPAVHSVARHRGIRTPRYKLIDYYQTNEWELFDLEKDPQEMHSVYDEAEYAPIVADLKQQLDQLRKEYRDEGPDPDAKPAAGGNGNGKSAK